MDRKTFGIGEYYHVYNRGVEKRTIFEDDRDYERFQRSLYIYNNGEPIKYRGTESKLLSNIEIDKKLTAIGSYNALPNHFHILVKEVTEGGITEFMRKLLTSYSKYFNIKHERKGPLFESRFYAEHVISDNHLKYLYSYINLNHLDLINPGWKKTGLKNVKSAKKFLKEYKYSSYIDLISEESREESIIINNDQFPEYFNDPKDFEEEVLEWLNFNN